VFKSDFEAFSSEGSGEVDTLLFGHRTYDMMKFWSTPQAEETQPEIARFMNEKLKVVASHQPFEPGWKNVTVISGDVPGAVRKLKKEPGQTIAMFGSNNLCVSLMQHGLIDEFQILVNPVVLGEGTSLFSGLPKKAELTLRDTRQFKSGVMMLTYAPLKR
jgi:dihydrofolate reductase